MSKKLPWDNKLTCRLNAIKTWQVACIIAVLGFGFFFSGLSGGFQGDDSDQIINNKAVHSIANIGLFFKSSTFWNGETLVGDFYRPTMTTTYSLVYTFFGANPIAYHVVQLIIYMACAFILFLFLKKFFNSATALLISLVFLVHPINSQVVFSIPSIQEPLMFIFGISALFVLSKSQTTKSLIIASILLFLSLMSKETAIVFVCMAALYLFLYNRDRVVLFIKLIVGPVLLFIILRISAVGFKNIAQSAPIDLLSFGERISMIPSMIMFYITKFMFPRDLATSYYWTNKSYGVEGFVIPLIFVLVCTAGFVFAGKLIYKRTGKKALTAYLFFAAWAVLGLLPHMQIIALDMTACETWLFSVIVGLLGMIALIIRSLQPHIQPRWIIVPGVLILMILGVRTELRGLDYHSQETLSLRDIAVTEKNYLAMNNLAKYYIDNNKPEKAEWYAQQSINYFPAVSNYINLGVIRQKTHNLAGAKQAYLEALKFVPLRVTYENIAIVNITIGQSPDNIDFLKKALAIFPSDNRLWTYLAIEDAAAGNNEEAKVAIYNAFKLGPVPPSLYNAIFNHQHLDIPLPDSDRIVHIY